MVTDTPSSGSAEVVALRGRVAELEAELARLRAEHRIAHDHEVLRHREHVLGLTVETETAHERNRLLSRRVTRLKERLAAQRDAAAQRERELRGALDRVHASRTWRLGRVLTKPARALRS